MKHTEQNNLIIGSDRLFNPRHKSGFYDLFRNQHDIYMLESDTNKDRDSVVESIRLQLDKEYSHKVFIGSGQDVYLLFDLYLDYGIVFDAAVLINCSYSDTIYLDTDNYRYNELVNGLASKTEIYNLYGKYFRYEPLPFAKINQNIPTLLPPSISSHYSLEAYGLLVYGLYEQVGLRSTVGRISYL